MSSGKYSSHVFGLINCEYEGTTVFQISVNIYRSTGRDVAEDVNFQNLRSLNRSSYEVGGRIFMATDIARIDRRPVLLSEVRHADMHVDRHSFPTCFFCVRVLRRT